MCKWGDQIILRVPIPANLAYNNKMRWDLKGVDRCIAPIVESLNKAGILTANSCCGHGKALGKIVLHDGRILTVKQKTKQEK